MAEGSSSMTSQIERFNAKWVRVPFCDCHIWTASGVPSGYGVFFFNGRQQYAHRVSWQISRGPIPAGQNVLHKCDVPGCVNPEHLFIGSTQDNYNDMVAKGRQRHPGAPRGFKHPNPHPPGERHPSAKLTQKDADEIRRLYATGKFKQVELGSKFNVRQALISRVVRNEAYQQ
jgi:hypothetical protein